MDELFEFIADAVAKKLREANTTVAAAEKAQAEAQQRAMLRASGFVVPEPPRAVAPSRYTRPATPAPAPSTRETVGHASRPNEPMGRTFAPLDDIFPTVIEPLRAAAPKLAAGSLLAAFSGGTPLLAAFVLSEALAPPIALRQRER